MFVVVECRVVFDGFIIKGYEVLDGFRGRLLLQLYFILDDFLKQTTDFKLSYGLFVYLIFQYFPFLFVCFINLQSLLLDLFRDHIDAFIGILHNNNLLLWISVVDPPPLDCQHIWVF